MRIIVATAAVLLFAPSPGAAQHDPHWTYEGANGPGNWGALAPSFASCAKGTRQSPIDIPSAKPLSPDRISFAYSTGKVEVLNTGHTVQLNTERGSSFELKGTRYELVQLHFHTPSEHTIDQRHGAMEAHFVHRDSAGKLAVIGVFLREGAENPDLGRVMPNMPQVIGKPVALPGGSFDPMLLLPPNREYWLYSGSLTTPPCTEDVTWIVMKDPVELSRAQIDAFVARLHHNARPVQPLGTRAIGVHNPLLY